MPETAVLSGHAAAPHYLSVRDISRLLIVPVMLGTAIYFALSFFPTGSERNFLYLFLVMFMFDTGHAVATFNYLRINNEVRQNISLLLLAAPIAILTLAYFLFELSPVYYYRAAGYLLLFHTVMQQYAWFKKSFTKMLPIYIYNIYRLMFLAIVFIPLLYLHTGKSPLGTFYYRDGVILTFLPQQAGLILTYLHFLILACGVAAIVYLREIQKSTLLVLACSWLIYFYGIMLAPNRYYYWCTLLVSHGFAYYLYTSEYSGNSEGKTPGISIKERFKALGKSGLATHLSFIIFFNILWFGSIVLYDTTAYLAPVLLLPSLVHCLIDSIIWKTNFRNNCRRLQPVN
jgi:hypothetical protein